MMPGEKMPRIRVLLVEDSPTDVLLARAALRGGHGAEFEVSSADHLQAAIESVKASPVDVILLDLGLPDAQGMETFVRAHAAMPDIPIVVLSGLGDEEVALQAVHQGAQDYLLKGSTMRDLLPRAIRYAVERHHTQQKLEQFARELQEKNASLEQELSLAREVQQALLPHHYPCFKSIPGEGRCALEFAHRYCPATSLSGDFFDILPLSLHQAGVLICDVMGHGVRAAFIGALTRGLVQQSVALALDPGAFLTSLNHDLAETLKHSEIEAFVTAFYFVADVAERRLRYANAGHPSPMILRRDTGTVDWLRVDRPYRPPLGLRSSTAYLTYEAPLVEHDSIVLFTDGIYEQENAAGEQFGQQRLLEAVSRRLGEPCGTMLDGLVSETRQFSGHDDFTDDVCLVGMDVVTGQPSGAGAA